MLKSVLSTLGLSGILIAVSAAGALAATPVKVDGTLVGRPVPPAWRITGAALVGNNGKIYIRVDSEGNCRNEWREECQTYPDGHVVCRPVPEWRCDYDYSLFQLPSTIRIADKNVFWNDGARDIQIGVVKSFLFWKWISLRDGADIQAGYVSASLLLDVGRLTGSSSVDQASNFEQLHGSEAEMGLLVSFRGLSNTAARKALEAAGYAGEYAPINNWSGADPARDQIGIRVSPREGAALITRLQSNPLVTGIKPYVEVQ